MERGGSCATSALHIPPARACAIMRCWFVKKRDFRADNRPVRTDEVICVGTSITSVVLRGDGIGPEIVAEAVKVLDAAGEKFGFRFAYDEQLVGRLRNRCNRRAAAAANGGGLQKGGFRAARRGRRLEVGCPAPAASSTGGGTARHPQPRWGCLRTCGPAKIFQPLKSASPIKDGISHRRPARHPQLCAS